MQNLFVVFWKYAQSIPAIKAAVGESLTFNQLCCVIQVFKEHLGIVEGLQCMEKIVAKVKRFHSAKCIGALYKVAVTAGYSTNTVESGFSALANIDLPQRQRMRDHRESDLTILSFEKDFARGVTFEEFLAKWVTKARRLNVTL